MAARSVSRSVEAAAFRLLDAERRLQWRTRHFGYPCLTEREAEAMRWEYDYMMLDASGMKTAIARRMGISHVRVIQLLDSASAVMEYLSAHEYRFGFVGWHNGVLIAPVARVRDYEEARAA